GYWTQDLDAPGSKKDAMYNGVNRENMEKYHFVSERRLAEMRKQMYDAPGSLEGIGEYFHALEDTYAHTTGDGHRNWEYHDYFGIGHGLLGHAPDFTWRDPVKSLVMAMEVYDELRRLAEYSGSAGQVTSWYAIFPTVQRFVSYEPETYQDIKYGQLVTTATFEGYNAKIQILDSSFHITDDYRTEYGDAAHRASIRWKVIGRSALPLPIPLGGY
ncbi:MAG: hypothetical protein MN733_20095, partial [Nitrososphaera sp.]|nr:hypothetical protein [Nitrososphaera sp.]